MRVFNTVNCKVRCISVCDRPIAKCAVITTPFSAYLNTTSAIIGIGVMSNVVASLFHVVPNRIKSRVNGMFAVVLLPSHVVANNGGVVVGVDYSLDARMIF